MLSVILPAYNEEKMIQKAADTLDRILEDAEIPYELVFVNDGSKDKTWDIIKELHEENVTYSGINLSRNRGHQNALLAGLMTAKDYADMVISMDADLQDDINAMDKMVDSYLAGSDIVYGVRNKREKDTFFKKFTAEGFYKIMNKMGAEVVFNHADYRLMSKKALEGLSNYKEVNLFLRGIVPMIGYKTDVVTYERGERFAGESKYPLGKMISFAIQGITSLSVKPMRMIVGLGFLTSFISILMMIYSVFRHFTGHTVTGWSSLMTSIWFLGGLNLLAIGIVGEYIGKIYLETKSRPRYIIDEFINSEE